MNRLILIGNGFDLAHGLKTSFGDFLNTYIKEVIHELSETHKYSDELINVGFQISADSSPLAERLEREEPIKIWSDIISRQDLFKVDYKMRLFQLLIIRLQKAGWVDIEYEFFNQLKEITNRKDFESFIYTFNKQFGYLKSKLIEYLKSVEISRDKVIQDYTNYFLEKVRSQEFSYRGQKDQPPRSIYFLNFNYTPLAMHYLEKCREVNEGVTINYIHGMLKDEESIIFGFGDEHDEMYKEFEHLNNRDVYRYIKSMAYSKYNYYFELMRFLDAAAYQVQIFGHSCGVSDRTMLREIFEHQHCRSIKIFYYQRKDGTTDFEDKVIDIYRHFEDKGKARKLIVPEKFCSAMPQSIDQ